MNRQISRIDLRLPERWCGWRPGEGPRAARQAASDLAVGPVAENRLRSALEAIDRAVVALNSRHVRVGAWVPDGSGDVVAGLACELLAEAPDGPDAAEAYLGRVQRKIYRSRRTATRVTYHTASLREVAAGRAVVTLRSHGVIRHDVIWTVFPPGSVEAIELRFDTRSTPRYQEVVDEADRIGEQLGVALTGDPAGSAPHLPA